MLRENFTISNVIFARQVIFSSRVNRINKISGVSNPAWLKRYIQEISWKMVLAGFVDTLYMYSEAVVVLWRTSACMSTACAVLNCYSTPSRGAKYGDESVCLLWLSVCPRARFRNYLSNLRQFLCMLWPWLGASLAALRYTMYFRF